MQILRGRLHEMEYNRLHAERSATRADQVGSGDRTEKIRTYNFAQNRVTDHRFVHPTTNQLFCASLYVPNPVLHAKNSKIFWY